MIQDPIAEQLMRRPNLLEIDWAVERSGNSDLSDWFSTCSLAGPFTQQVGNPSADWFAEKVPLIAVANTAGKECKLLKRNALGDRVKPRLWAMSMTLVATAAPLGSVATSRMKER